jgi:DivIVA domain-containing protein
MDRTPLAPGDVRDVIFAKAPLGRRGYHETQVDDFLDRIEATLAGTDTVTAEDVRTVVFEYAPLIKRGYHEEQVDNFLDIVVGELELRERDGSSQPAMPNGGAPARRTAAPSHAEQTSPMLFALPPSLSADEPTPTTQPLRPKHLTEEAPSTQPLSPAEVLALPLPPAPQGTRGYRPGDVERLAKLLAGALTGAADQDDATTPTAADVANTKLTRTFFIGQGYHTDVVDALRAAWVEELRHRES